MENSRIPLIAVIGGLWQLTDAHKAAAKAAGMAIGAELAKAGFGLVVYFSNDESLEPHVVSGYAQALSDRSGEIRVRYAQSQRGQVKFGEETTRPDLFHHDLFPSDDWEAPFYRSLAEEEGIDAVLLLGGATSTLIAGQIAVARRLPVLVIDAFGGSAAKIWNQLAQASPQKPRPSWGTKPPAAFVEQLKDECAVRAASRQEVRRRGRLITTITAQRQQAGWAAGAFFLLVVALFFGMVWTPTARAYPLIIFAGLIFAGATGALVRAMIWGPGESDARISLLLGSVAGFVVGLAYLIPQWVGAPGVLETRVSAISATDKIQFASAVLVAISAGVGFDTVFGRLRKQAQDVPVGPT